MTHHGNSERHLVRVIHHLRVENQTSDDTLIAPDRGLSDIKDVYTININNGVLLQTIQPCHVRYLGLDLFRGSPQ